MNRRKFIDLAGKAILVPPAISGIAGRQIFNDPDISRLSPLGKHHFFGYYGINPWDQTGQYHLALETDFDDRPPTMRDVAKVGFIDRQTNLFTSLAETAAFNLQQGTMMHWIDAGFGEEFTYNGYDGKRLVSYALHFTTKKIRKIDGAIAAVSPNHREGIGLDFQRMSMCRPTVGYAQDIQDYELVNIPDQDGLYALDLTTGHSSLLLSIREVISRVDLELPREQPAWFNHVLYNENGERLLFFCRVRKKEGGFLSSLWTIKKDGSDLQCQIPFGFWISHFDWKDHKTILITTDVRGKPEYLEFPIGSNRYKSVGPGILTVDGHCSYLPDKDWIVSDTYPQGEDHAAELFLFNIRKNKKISLGKFPHDLRYKGVIRCDLHPRVSKDGKTVSFDSVHEGSRQIYTVDIFRRIR